MHKLNPPPKYGVIGHRGVAGLRPENTYCSFKKAAELGLNWVEFDVHLTKDRHWVVIHDDTLDRTTNGRGRVRDHTLAELKQFDAGLWFEPPFTNESIPTLQETLNFCKANGLQANIEIKGSEQDYLFYAEQMYEFLKRQDTLAQLPLISSFDLNCLVVLRQMLPEQPISYLVDACSAASVVICAEHDFASLNCDVQNFTREDLRRTTDNGLPVLLFTVNDPLLAQQWLDAGVTAVFSDRPDLLIKIEKV